MSRRDTPSPLLVAGILVASAAALTFGSIGFFFASGAVADDPTDPISSGRAFAEAGPLLDLSAYLGIAGNVVFAVAALMLAHAAAYGAPEAGRRVALPGIWATLTFSVVLIVPYDLALPSALVPLAQADATSPVFAAFYNSLTLAHSVGLVVFYAATTALFAVQAATAERTGHKVGWRIATGISVLAVVVGIGLTIGRPPLLLVPAVFLTWAGLLWLGIRMVLRDAREPSTQPRDAGAAPS